MEKSYFFNSVNGDRFYDAEDMSKFFSKYFTNGVFNGGLSVEAVDGSMQVKITKGAANIDGKGYENDNTDSDLLIPISIGDAQYPRIDNICIRKSVEDRKITAIVEEGIAQSTPSAKNPQRTSLLYDLVIAQITVPAGTTEITQSMIKDTRFDSNLCGIVTGTVQQIDTTNVFAQYDAYFNSWFENLQTQLDGDVAGNLQNEITNLRTALGLNVNTFTTGESYNVGDMVIYNHLIYECNVPHVAEEFESEKWDIVPIIKN